MKKAFALVVIATLLGACTKKEKTPEKTSQESSTTQGTNEDTSHVKWETNLNDPIFASAEAVPGGTWTTWMLAYPLTFRLHGPNSNGAFANWNRNACWLSLVNRHPNTLKPLPQLATHWSVQKDQKTVYFKLDPDAKFNDGTPITADHYVFSYKKMLSKHIKDPWSNKYYGERIESVEKVEDHVLKIVGKYESWRALWEFQIMPEPSHSQVLDEGWAKRMNWKTPVCPGPYKLAKKKRGRYVEFHRIKNWWGDNKKYFKHRFNFEKIHIKVIRDENVAWEHFKKGKLSTYSVRMASRWVKETNFDQIKKNWIVKKRIFNEVPRGLYGIIMNLGDRTLKDRNIRLALQHLFDFKKINKSLMYDAYIRKRSVFSGTQYANPKLKPYPFNPKIAKTYLEKAGYKKRGPDGFLVNGKGQKLTITMLASQGGLEKHMSIFQEDLRKAGVELKFRMVDPATNFKYLLERNYQLGIAGMSAGFYPQPGQYFHSSYTKTKNNNNFFKFGDPKVDKLLETYQKNLNFKERQKALHKVDQIVHDEAFIIKAWIGPYVRALYWNRYGTPKKIIQKMSSSINDYFTWWIDPKKEKALTLAMKEKKPLPSNGPVDMDPYQVRR